MTNDDSLLASLIDAPRSAPYWAVMVGAVSVFDARLLARPNTAGQRLQHIVKKLGKSGIVNQPTLGHYWAKKIMSSFLLTVNYATLSTAAFRFIGGATTTTAVLTRLGRVVGQHKPTENARYPALWQLKDADIYKGSIYAGCYVGRLSGKMVTVIRESSGVTGSASSVSSERAESVTALLVANIPI